MLAFLSEGTHCNFSLWYFYDTVWIFSCQTGCCEARFYIALQSLCVLLPILKRIESCLWWLWMNYQFLFSCFFFYSDLNKQACKTWSLSSVTKVESELTYRNSWLNKMQFQGSQTFDPGILGPESLWNDHFVFFFKRITTWMYVTWMKLLLKITTPYIAFSRG